MGLKKCIYEIKAKGSKKVQIRIVKELFKSSEYCFPKIALQIKYHKDKTIVSPTFCCNIANQDLIGQDSRVNISYVGTQSNHMLKFKL